MPLFFFSRSLFIFFSEFLWFSACFTGFVGVRGGFLVVFFLFLLLFLCVLPCFFVFLLLSGDFRRSFSLFFRFFVLFSCFLCFAVSFPALFLGRFLPFCTSLVILRCVFLLLGHFCASRAVLGVFFLDFFVFFSCFCSSRVVFSLLALFSESSSVLFFGAFRFLRCSGDF